MAKVLNFFDVLVYMAENCLFCLAMKRLMAIILLMCCIAGAYAQSAEDVLNARTSAEVSALMEKAEARYYTPNSPEYDEDAFISVLEAVVSSTVADDARVRAQLLLEEAKKNRPGTVAADFSVVGYDGKELKLSDFTSEFVLLLFYDPTCDDCAKLEQDLAENDSVKAMIDSGRLTLLCVYTDEDESLWRSNMVQKPLVGAWNADGSIIGEGKYDIRSIPEMYLISGKDKKIVAKRPALGNVLSILNDSEH